MHILFANESTLMEVLFPAIVDHNQLPHLSYLRRICGGLMHAEQNATKLLREGRCGQRSKCKALNKTPMQLSFSKECHS
jgi:hypothetical protein